MTIFILKIIACICMLIDHTTAVFMPSGVLVNQIDLANSSTEVIQNAVLYTLGRGIGRLAFPIFCFALVEGFVHTKNLKRYFIRLGVFAFVSEFFFDYALYGFATKESWSHQNIFMTLIVGLAVLAGIDYIQRKFPGDMIKYNTFSLLFIVAGGAVAEYFQMDYGFFGIILIGVLFVLRGKNLASAVMFIVLVLLAKNPLEMLGILAFPLFMFYKGKKGPSLKYAFYAFYPLHLLILGLINNYIIK